ncbi:hypothetical protein F0562_021357 [Nyssa sinensis]|uniref:Glutaredoxin domain-containing protein n=1 Tax=Nyssa sinensis TaxID=561372 RepID=A0A5J5BKJ4_9ASTE|nr:hypothetical protein F0562_021357 [Nyssa sinensis]
MDRVKDLASRKAAVIFTQSSCFMCHSIKTLFYELGASPAIHELDQDTRGKEMEWALRDLGCNPAVPAVFIGGKFVGSAKDVISLHVDGKFVDLIECGTLRWIRVNPLVYEIDQDPEGREMEKAFVRLGCNAPVPAVFIAGKLVGSTNEVMSLHLSGSLIPLLKPYQATVLILLQLYNINYKNKLGSTPMSSLFSSYVAVFKY